MTMQKDDLEQVIRDDLYSEAEAIQKEVDASGMEDISSTLKDDIRLKLQNHINNYEEERAYDRLSERDKEALKLGRKLQKKHSVSKTMRRKKRWKMYAASAAAVVLILTVGMTSMGGAERVISVIEQVVGERKVVKVNSDEGNKVSENEDEERAYQEIKEEFGVTPVRLTPLNKNIQFMQMNMDHSLQMAEILYQYDDKNLLYIVNAGYYDSSFGFDMEDEIVDKEIMKIGGNDIELIIYQIKETGESKCLAHFTYQKLEYFLAGQLEKEDFKILLENLYFL